MKILTKTLKFILEILPDGYRLKLLGVSLLLLVNSLLELLGLTAILPIFAVLLEDNVIEQYKWASWIYTTFGMSDEKQLILVLCTSLFGIILMKNILSIWIIKIISNFSLGLSKVFTIRLHKLYYERGFRWFKSTNSNIISRDLRTATNQFANVQVLGTLNLLNEIIVIIFITTAIAIYNFQILLLLALTVIPPFLLFYNWVRKQSIELGNRRNEVDPILGKNIFQSIFGYVDVIVTGSEKAFRKKIKRNLDQVVDIEVKTNVYNLIPTRIIETSLMLAIAIVVSYGIYFLPSKIELLKAIGLFAVAGYRIMPSINRMMVSINGLNRSQWIFPKLLPLKNYDNQSLSREQKPINFKHSLSLKKISFSYSEGSTKIFDNYSLEIKKGEVIGLVGPSGAGKTTLMNILLGFLQPTEGKYLIDNTQLTANRLNSFYKKIGYVQQNVYLIDGTIAENVAFGVKKVEIDQTRLQEVLKRASLWELVKDMPEGIDEMIGENGTKLSGGQRQRIGIARALYFKAEILFFDEATSSLDEETEKDITHSIQSLTDGELTMIIIAHRKTTLKHCNRIIEINTRKKKNAIKVL